MKPKLDKDAIDDAIQKIDTIDIEKVSVKEIERLLQPIFTGYHVNAPVFDPGKILIYRGRVCSKPRTYSEIIYPKSEYIKRYGRANDIGQSMFYAAVGRIAPFAEINAKTGDTVVMSYWTTKTKLMLNHVGFTDDIAQLLISKRKLDSIYEFVKEATNFDDLNQFVYNYLASKFITKIADDENFKYKISVAITNKLLGEPFGGIMYPSIALFGNADNIVLVPDFVGEHLQLISIEFVEIKSINSDEYSIDILDTATTISDDGTIQWSGRLLVTTPFRNMVARSENGEWIKWDPDGNLILPRCDGDLISSLTPLKRLYRKELDHGWKLTKEFVVSQIWNNVTVLVSLIFITNSKEKYISIYISSSTSATEIAMMFIGDYKKYEDFDEGKEIGIRSPNGEVEFSSKGSLLTNTVEIYSETLLNESVLKEKFKELNLKFVYAPDIKNKPISPAPKIVYHYIPNK